ncbi:MAG TPA: MBL fold metallo-hydrolase [Rubrobacter sp.]|nr:MBL fold metallo-hydrolase [Rubrobacter sp.]
MDTGSFRFEIGEFRCAAISDGALNYPPESFFANAPPERVEAVLRGHGLPAAQILTPYTCLFIDTGDHRVLVDTGAGNLGAHAAQVFPGLDHSTSVTGLLLENMRGAGIEPSDVDTVIITHAHPDHIGGTLDEAGRLVFGDAGYFISQDEWDFWNSDMATSKAPAIMVDTARRNLDPIKDRLTLVEDESEIVPGVRAIATFGHTPGHIALSIASGGRQLLHVSDAVLYPLHLEYPEWTPIFDMLPEQAAASKRRIFDLAAEGTALVFAHHFPPFPNLGHVSKMERGWLWQPRGSGHEPRADSEA